MAHASPDDMPDDQKIKQMNPAGSGLCRGCSTLRVNNNAFNELENNSINRKNNNNI